MTFRAITLARPWLVLALLVSCGRAMDLGNAGASAWSNLRVVVASKPWRVTIRLTAGDHLGVHLPRAWPFGPFEFDIPAVATRSRELQLRWTSGPGLGGAGRGPQVAEVGLVRT